jgi:small neutral amino acid transporter SnatA (MarC family)
LFSIGAVSIAASLGERMLDNFAIPVLVLQIAAGLILFLVALQAVMQQYSAAHPSERTEPPSLALAFSPLAFPMIVTPYGIAAVTILMALAPTTQIRLTVAGVVFFILFLDWLAMLAARVIVRWLGPLLLLLGVVLGVNQVALGLQLMIGGISGLIAQGAFTTPSNGSAFALFRRKTRCAPTGEEDRSVDPTNMTDVCMIDPCERCHSWVTELGPHGPPFYECPKGQLQRTSSRPPADSGL